jgi:UDP-N-acetylmuramoylalanine--D-glutamate ligase
VEYEQMVIKTLGNRVTFPLNQLALSGKHNICNGMAASLAALGVDTPIQAVIEGLKDFEGVEHRLESVDEVNGVLYINDSKATNVDSVWYALESMDKPVVWIAGGTDKGNDYTLLEDLAGQKVKTLICLGVDNRKLISAFTGKIPEIVETRSMADAVSVAQKQSKPGDVVLLSPACASFDLFKNYEHRGKLFKEEVYKLKNQYE